MEKKKSLSISTIALTIGILPLATFIPVLLGLSLSEETRTIWAGLNLLFVFTSLILSISCVKNRKRRNIVSIFSTVLGGFWVLLMGGTLALALLINFMQ